MTAGVTEQAYLSVGDLARASGVAPSAVRFYEAHGLLAEGTQRRQPAPFP